MKVMDFHILPTKDDNRTKSHLARSLKKFIPVFALSLFMPVLLFFAVNPPDLNFTPQANQKQQLRLWFEPSAIVASVGEPVEVKLMGSVENEFQPVQSISVNIKSADSLSITPSTFVYADSFVGRTTLKVIEVTPTRAGEFVLEIPKQNVTTSLGEIDIITSSAHVSVNR